MDALASVFHSVRVGSVRMVQIEGAGSWSLRVEQTDGGVFHWLKGGGGVLHVEGSAPVPIRGTRAILLPHGQAHSLRDGTCAPVSLVELLSQSSLNANPVIGVGDPSVTLVSGLFRMDASCDHPLLAALPGVILLAADEARDLGWLEMALQHAARRSDSGEPGNQAICNRLADVLLVRLVASYLSALGGDGEERLHALVDPHVGAALRMIHEQPAHAWTVAGLAARVGMSRSAFAARFAELVAEPPAHYIARCRMP